MTVKNVQVRIEKKLYRQAKLALEEDGKTWQGYLTAQIKKLVKKKKRK